MLSLYATAPLALYLVELIGPRSPVAKFGPQITAPALIGFFVGIAGLAILFWVQLRLGWLQTVGGEPPPKFDVGKAICLSAILAIGVGLVEEIIFRGFLFTQFSESFSPYAAASLSSLIFALLHLVWDRENTQPQLIGLWIMGMVLAWAYALNGFSIGLPWGLHAGWILGIAVVEIRGQLTPTGQVPLWVTGGAGRPLAGLGATGFLLATAAVLWLIAAAGLVG
ncbi:MAG: CPBP family intramembrane glutamic endopeptidase [Cyanobacteria bacterium P01_A01_bin.135]